MERGSGHNDKLDLWKCVAIYSVIFIHILLPGQIGVAVRTVRRASTRGGLRQLKKPAERKNSGTANRARQFTATPICPGRRIWIKMTL